MLSPSLLIYTVFSDQPRNVIAKEGDGISLSCKRSDGTLAEWQFLFENGERLLYSQNAPALADMDFTFHDSEAVEENLRTFSVNVIVTKAMHNLIVTCAAKNTENGRTKFNKFADHIVILDDDIEGELKVIGISDHYCTEHAPQMYIDVHIHFQSMLLEFVMPDSRVHMGLG